MEVSLLSKKILANRWEVSTTTIDRWVLDGVISPVKGLPSVRFNLNHILELEGTDISKMSPLERRRLEKEIKELENKKNELEKENQELKDYVKNIIGNGVKFIDVG